MHIPFKGATTAIDLFQSAAIHTELESFSKCGTHSTKHLSLHVTDVAE